MSKVVFISHSSKDAHIASELCEYLENNGKKCFIAPRDIQYGNEYAEEIINGIDNSESMVLLLSNNSNNSPHVLREIERAVSKSIPIIIYKLEDVELSKSMEYFLMTHQWMDAKKTGDFTNILKCVNNISKDNPENGNKENQEENSTGTDAAKKNPKKKIAAVAALILSAIIIVAAVFLISNHTKPSNQNRASENNNAGKALEVGDTITFGQYNNEEIEWRVLRLSEDGKEAVLISKNILCMKAYDAAESGKYNTDKDGNNYYGQKTEADTDWQLQVQVRGNSDWSLSNIRTWLNSSDEVVQYKDQAPTAKAMSELKNGYNNEPGFLYGFKKDEIAAIKAVENETAGNKVSSQDTIKTEDRVYLLSLDELKWFEEAGISMLAEPTQAAINNDDAKWYEMYLQNYSVKEHYWWLREPEKEYSSKSYLVGNGYLEDNIFSATVGLEGYGIRPAITVYVDKLAD